jgi:hypothetical protein
MEDNIFSISVGTTNYIGEGNSDTNSPDAGSSDMKHRTVDV